MANHRETKSSAPPNIQDVFLNSARRERLIVTIRLMDGQVLDGRIKNFDRFALVVEHEGADHMVFKHAIATIRSNRSIANYFSTSASHDG
jgi:host factor-I protein